VRGKGEEGREGLGGEMDGRDEMKGYERGVERI
jgi:hypothetical protein